MKLIRDMLYGPTICERYAMRVQKSLRKHMALYLSNIHTQKRIVCFWSKDHPEGLRCDGDGCDDDCRNQERHLLENKAFISNPCPNDKAAMDGVYVISATAR